MSELTSREARERFSEAVNRAAYGRETIILTRRGKRIAAIVPFDLAQLEAHGGAELAPPTTATEVSP
jgi:prevent-host-death family protein